MRTIQYVAPYGGVFQTVLGSFTGSIAAGERVYALDLSVNANSGGSAIIHFSGVVNKIRKPTTKSTVIGVAGAYTITAGSPNLGNLITSLNGSINYGDRIIALKSAVAAASDGTIGSYFIVLSKETGYKKTIKPQLIGYVHTSLPVGLGSFAGSYSTTENVNRLNVSVAQNTTTGSAANFVIIGAKIKKGGVFDNAIQDFGYI